MKLLIDLQACQTPSSRTRGIGRYSMALALAMAERARGHEVHLGLNGNFPDSIADIRQRFAQWVPPSRVHVWELPRFAGHVPLPERAWRRMAAEALRLALIEAIKPDAVHIASLMEGYDSDAVASVDPTSPVMTAVTLYDLIPLQHAKMYLAHAQVDDWYRRKISELAKADLQLAISESSRQEAISLLGAPADIVENVLCDADAPFRKLDAADGSRSAARSKFALTRPFVMYTGGIDFRKNIEGLITAFAELPGSIRAAHQLAIVCSVKPDERIKLESLAKTLGLESDALVLTGFVSDQEMIALYNECTLFVFPSWHEGFGLPALEAMRCGAPVIGSNCTSIPEVIGRDDAQFDPHSTTSIRDLIAKALTDTAFLADLRAWSTTQSSRFSWKISAEKAWVALERTLAGHLRTRPEQGHGGPSSRPRLAYVSPMPPSRSGIADYSAGLLSALSKYYQIDVVCPDPDVSTVGLPEGTRVISVPLFVEYAHDYERVLYHFGNSSFHGHMPALLSVIPGTVVLHDFFLSGLAWHMQLTAQEADKFSRELLYSHGAAALVAHLERGDLEASIYQYPSNRRTLDNADGIISHSRHSGELAEAWYGPAYDKRWAVVPLARPDTGIAAREQVRPSLGVGVDDFVICSFGFVANTKLSDRIYDAWCLSEPGRNRQCHLVFVGQNDAGPFGKALGEKIAARTDIKNVRITGYASTEEYHQWLGAADAAIQLRRQSRGETSAAVLDVMMAGVPVVVNAHGSLAELSTEAVTMLPDDVDVPRLREMFNTLWREREQLPARGRASRDYALAHHSTEQAARLYWQAIERFHRARRHRDIAPAGAAVTRLGLAVHPSDGMAVGEMIRDQLAPADSLTRVLLDTTAWHGKTLDAVAKAHLKALLRDYSVSTFVMPFYRDENDVARYAVSLLLDVLGQTWQHGPYERCITLDERDTVIVVPLAAKS
ncbi:glycosyltransferase [Robbsia sp. KACC 23696]|uniref:glycosyltransferase n=1 Tax=Robbsia sp. KACC 23696 TaxID=3149231 RepID=UPI00325B2E7B